MKSGIFAVCASFAALAAPFAAIFASTIAVSALSSGCTARSVLLSDERPRYFVLSSNTRESADTARTLPIVAFSRISIPSYLDVPQIVTREDNEIVRSEINRWGESLARAVSRELALRTAASLVELSEKDAAAAEPVPAGTPPAAEPVAATDPKVPEIASAVAGTRVRVVIDRFDGTLHGNVVLSAVYTLSPNSATDGSGITKLFKTSVPVAEPNDCDAYVHALDTALDALAADIAASLKKF